MLLKRLIRLETIRKDGFCQMFFFAIVVIDGIKTLNAGLRNLAALRGPD